MFERVAEKLVIADGGSLTRAIRIDQANAVDVRFDLTVLGDDVRVTIELGSDGQNWITGDNSGTKSAIGSYAFKSVGLPSSLLRLRLNGKGSIVDACIEPRRL